MPANERYINITFAEGLDTKTDPKQVAIGRFLSMVNSVFTTGKRLTKRDGNQLILSNSTASYLTTLNKNLTAIGNSVYAYNTANETTITKGVYAPMEISTVSLIRNSVNQVQVDSATAPNGLVCIAYTETTGVTTSYKYAVINSETGQNIVAPTLLPNGAGAVTGSPKVFLIGNYFVVAFTNDISGSFHLQYIAISTFNPTAVTTAADIAAAYNPSSSVAWDGVVVGDNIYFAYNTASGGQAVKITYLPVTSIASGSTPSATVTFLGYTASIVSLCADTTGPSVAIYLSWFNSSTGYTASVSAAPNFSVTMLPVETIPSGTILNLASAAQNGVCTLFYEVQKAYSYDASTPTNFINSVSVTPTGNPVSFHSIFSSGASTITASSSTGLVNGMYLVDSTTAAHLLPNTTFTHSGTTLTLSQNTQGNSASNPGDLMLAQAITLSSPITVIRSVGLASKAFIVAGVIYFLSAYESSAAAGAGFQPTYFLINGSTSTQASPAVVAKLAYSNGGGYLSTGIPNVTTSDNVAQVTYLFKDLIESQAPTAIQSIGLVAPAVYSQTGINLATFTIGTQNIGSVEIADTLQLTGGFGWLYDGYLPVEENFLVWPDSVESVSSVATVSVTGTVTAGSKVITAVSSTASVIVGMAINATGVSGSAIVVSFTAATITMNVEASASHSAESVTLFGDISNEDNSIAVTRYYQAIYAWTDNQGNIYRSAPSIPVVVEPIYSFTVSSATMDAGDIYSVSGVSYTVITSINNGSTLLASGSVAPPASGTLTRVTGSKDVTATFSASAIYSGTYFNTINIPTLRLTYKTANPVRIQLYRWSTIDQVYYQVTSISQPLLNLTTTDSVSFVDVVSDAQLVGNEILYTTGGTVENINSSASNLITTFDTRAWKVRAEDSNVLEYSKQIIENVPVDWSDLFTYYVAPNTGTTQSTGGVTAFAPMDDKLILFKGIGNVICFINGTGPDNTGANSQYPTSPYSIVSPVGCDNQASVVLMPAGLMFQANQGSGIWLLDRGLNVTYIGKDVEKYNASTVTSAVSVKGTTEVRFTLNTGEVLVYDYFYGQWDTFEGNSAVSSCLYNGLHTYLNKFGQVYQQNPGSYLDGTNPVLMSFETGPIYIAGISGYQRAIELILTGTYESPTRLIVQIAFNFGQFSQQYIITPDNATGVYGSDSFYGQTSPHGGPGKLLQWRIPFDTQQCQSFQISAQEVFDPSVGQVAGAGFTLSNINCLILAKSGKRPFSAAHTQG